VLSPTLYAHVVLDTDAELTVDDEHAERGVYVVEGEIGCGGRVFSGGNLVVMKPGRPFALSARNPARVMIIGGAKLDGERHIFWNFVSSSKERIERAKDDWRTRRFAPIPGDDEERIPLPD
jgi:redox-sensitive bicupin YhaK (pirin superfamily)